MADSMPAGGANSLDTFSSMISGSRRPGGETTVEARAAIIAAVQAGDKKALIAQRFGISVAAIQRTLVRFQLTGQLTSLPRSGRPRTRVRRYELLKSKAPPRPGPAHDSDLRRGVGRAQAGVRHLPATAPGPTVPSPAFDTPPSTLLANLTATLFPTTYVFASFRDPTQLPPMPQIQLFFQEPEGITIVTSLGYARAHNLQCFFPCRMISLNFTASAEVAGHTAVLMARLAARNLGVKSVSGFFRDHLLVPLGREDEAMQVLAAVAKENQVKLAAAAPAEAKEAQPAQGQIGEAQPEQGQPEAAQPEAAQPEQGQAEEAQPGEDQLEEDQSEEARPEDDQLENEQMEEAQSEEEYWDPSQYEDAYFEKHQCSEVDSEFDAYEEDASEEDTSRETSLKAEAVA